SPLMKLSAAAGFDDIGFGAVTFDQIRPGCWQQKERLVDMDANHMDASICFPNTLPRFCGQAFAERKDKELALLCVKAYNDWMIDEWCAGDGRGRLTPLTMVPLWTPSSPPTRCGGARPRAATPSPSRRTRSRSGCRRSTPRSGIRCSRRA